MSLPECLLRGELCSQSQALTAGVSLAFAKNLLPSSSPRMPSDEGYLYERNHQSERFEGRQLSSRKYKLSLCWCPTRRFLEFRINLNISQIHLYRRQVIAKSFLSLPC